MTVVGGIETRSTSATDTNTAAGYQALAANTTGGNNTAAGYAGDPADNAARNEFARKMVIQYVKNIVRGVEQSKAQTI